MLHGELRRIAHIEEKCTLHGIPVTERHAGPNLSLLPRYRDQPEREIM
jgi:hypothetical protein